MRFKYEIHQPQTDVFQLVEFDRNGGSIEGRVVAESHLFAEMVVVKNRYEALQESQSVIAVNPPVKADERPNKYSILQSDTGKWQILKKTEKDGHWMVFVKDCGTKRLAVLMLNAIMQSVKEGTPEQRIMNASDG